MEGICGNANGDDSDDFKAPDGSTPANQTRKDIESIINTWKYEFSFESLSQILLE